LSTYRAYAQSVRVTEVGGTLTSAAEAGPRILKRMVPSTLGHTAISECIDATANLLSRRLQLPRPDAEARCHGRGPEPPYRDTGKMIQRVHQLHCPVYWVPLVPARYASIRAVEPN
jgi:hypothetical protein